MQIKKLQKLNIDLNFAFLGSTNYSKEMLLFLIKNGFIPSIIFYIPEKFKIKIQGVEEEKINSNYADLTQIAKKYNIPYHEVNSVNGKRLQDYKEIIKNLNLDLFLVLGWYYMISKEIRSLAKYGAWGIHASLLPKYAGGAPLVWAMINGEKETGVTLFRMEDGVDDGDIISQKKFSIDFEDTIKDVYDKATITSKDILLNTLKNIENINFTPQDKSKIEVFPQRNPSDGMINWYDTALNIYNFIRAQTLPYPCAFSIVDDINIKIISANITDIKNDNYKNGEIVLFDNKTFIATKDSLLKIGDVYVEGRRVKFQDFARAKRLWGGYSRAKSFKMVA